MSFNILSSSGNSLYYIALHIILVKMSISYWDSHAVEAFCSLGAQAPGYLLALNYVSGTAKYFRL